MRMRLAIIETGVISPNKYQVSNEEPAQAAMDIAISPVILRLTALKTRLVGEMSDLGINGSGRNGRSRYFPIGVANVRMLIRTQKESWNPGRKS